MATKGMSSLFEIKGRKQKAAQSSWANFFDYASQPHLWPPLRRLRIYGAVQVLSPFTFSDSSPFVMMLAVLLLHLGFFRIVQAIAVTDLPVCAQQCLSNSTSAQKSCSVIDIACLCSSSTYVAALSCCLATGCSTAEQATAIQFNKEECANVNETAPDFVGCSPGGLSSALSSMSLTFSQAGSASTASTASSIASSGTVNPSLTTLIGDAISETAAMSTERQITITSFAGAPLMTGSCTVPHFAVVTDAMGKVTEFPEIGCSPDRPDCCPFQDGLNAVITRCPQDYFTTASACCPLGYQIYYTNIGLATPCYSIPATSYVPATTPTIAGLTLITDHVFSQKYLLVPQKASATGFPFGGKIAIPISVWSAIIILVIIAIFYVRRRRKLKREAEANRATTFPAEEPAMHQISTSRAATMHELDSPEPQATSPSGGSAGWPVIAAQSPPAYDPHKTVPAPILTKQPPAPLELPGSTYIHEHHPAYSNSNAGSSVSTPTEITPGSPPGTPLEQKSPGLSSITPRSESHSPMFVSPLASPNFRKTG